MAIKTIGIEELGTEEAVFQPNFDPFMHKKPDAHIQTDAVNAEIITEIGLHVRAQDAGDSGDVEVAAYDIEDWDGNTVAINNEQIIAATRVLVPYDDFPQFQKLTNQRIPLPLNRKITCALAGDSVNNVVYRRFPSISNGGDSCRGGATPKHELEANYPTHVNVNEQLTVYMKTRLAGPLIEDATTAKLGGQITLTVDQFDTAINSGTINGVALTNISTTDATTVVATIPNFINAAPDTEVDIILEDDTGIGESFSVLVEAPANYAGTEAAVPFADRNPNSQLTDIAGLNQIVAGDYIVVKGSDDSAANISGDLVITSTADDVDIIVYDSTDNFSEKFSGTVIVNIDESPDSFTFTDLTDAQENTALTSNTITIAGINSPTQVSVDVGEFSVNGDAFSSTARSIEAGQTLQLRLTSGDFLANVSMNVTVGDVTDEWSITSREEVVSDTTPDAFVFTDLTEQTPSTQVSSNTVTITGINEATAVSINNGEFSVNGDVFSSTTRNITSGQTLQLRLTSGASAQTVTSTVTVGTLSVDWDVTSETVTQDTIPDALSFTNVTGVALSSQITSNSQTISGIDAQTSFSVVGGSFSKNGASFETGNGTVVDGDTIRLQVLSSSSTETASTVSIDFSGTQYSFTATTLSDSDPQVSLDFTNLQNQKVSPTIVSEELAISGLTSSLAISVVNGEYSKNGGSWTDVGGTVSNGDRVRIRTTPSADFAATKVVSLTIGNTVSQWSVTTGDEEFFKFKPTSSVLSFDIL